MAASPRLLEDPLRADRPSRSRCGASIVPGRPSGVTEMVAATDRPELSLAVVMEREAQPNRWEDWRFRVVEVLADEGFGTAPRLLRDDGRVARWLYPGFKLQLFRDEGEGYYLNLSSGAPVWFVTWRIDDEDPASAWPEIISVSYNEAGRWLDAQERVDNLPLPPDVVAWLQTYTDAHYRPEPKRRKRPASFLPPGQRG